jgi:hypothetical protein
MSDDPTKAGTYFHQAQLDPLPGGRWSGRGPRGVGSTPSPEVPGAAPEWARDPCGPEPPLGFSVDEVPDLGMGSDRRP